MYNTFLNAVSQHYDVNDCVATAECIAVDSLRVLTVVPGKSHRYCQARNRLQGQTDVGGGELIEKRCSTDSWCAATESFQRKNERKNKVELFFNHTHINTLTDSFYFECTCVCMFVSVCVCRFSLNFHHSLLIRLFINVLRSSSPSPTPLSLIGLPSLVYLVRLITYRLTDWLNAGPE